MLIRIPSGGNCSMSPLPEIPPSSLAAINISRSSQGYHKTPEGNMNLRVANLTKEKNFCTIWPWICRHVGIEISGLLWNELATSNGSCQALLSQKTITGLLAQQNLDTKQGNKKVAQNAYWLHTWRLIGSWWWRRHWIIRILGGRCNWPPQGGWLCNCIHEWWRTTHLLLFLNSVAS
jgi:hypothetical protein